MRKALNWLLALVVLAGTLTAGTATAAAAARSTGDVEDRIRAIPGMTVDEQATLDGYRYFLLRYVQPVDHRRPWRGTFEQRLSILHRGEDRPTVFHTSGYGLNRLPSRSEPTRLLDANQVSLEYRYFDPSRPEPADWSKLDIWQAAMDQHRVHRALDRIYRGTWISTGASKGGMTAVYYRRFFPHDMDGTVAYVAPNDVYEAEDSAYDRFFARVATEECRDRLKAAQREALVRREEMVQRYADWAGDRRATFEVIGGIDEAYESAVLDLAWTFWQYHGEQECSEIPEPTATTGVLFDFVNDISGLASPTDESLEYFTPYYYQAATQLGSPRFATPHLKGLLHHPELRRSATYLPEEVPLPGFQPYAMLDIDRWVRWHGSRMLFVNGENDPWSAEPFRLGPGSRDSRVLIAPGANHSASIEDLAPGDRETAVRKLSEWAGVPVAPRSLRKAEPAAPDNATLDRAAQEWRMRWSLRP